MSFGTQLRQWRKAKGLTQQELAVAVGVNVSYISNLERDFSATTKSGKPKASESLADKFAKVLEVDVDTIRLAAGHAPQSKNAFNVAIGDEVRLSLLHGAGMSNEDQQEFVSAFNVAYQVAKQRIAEKKQSGE